MQCFSLIRTDVKAVSANAITPNATPSGYGPANLASAYKLSTAGGAGETVAIVDANNDPTAAADLAMYRSQFGLPACTVASGCLQIVNQNGATSPLPANDAGWAGEESLDLDMVSAICPNCHIILVEASSATDANLYAAEDRAVAMGAKFVSNSWGGGESSTQTSDDTHFNHPGVAITVSSGDDATGAEYPATSQYVTAVGGTHLTTSTNSRGWTESAWADAGSGCSAFDAKPSWQTVTTGCARPHLRRARRPSMCTMRWLRSTNRCRGILPRCMAAPSSTSLPATCRWSSTARLARTAPAFWRR